MTPKQPLHWVVARFENGQAVLKNDGSELPIPRVQLPETAKVGDLVTAEFYFVKDEKMRRENLAKSLLEEILGKGKGD